MVDYITYKGGLYPVRFAWSTLKTVQSIKDLDVYQQAELALYCGLVSGHKAEDKEMPFAVEEMQFILDECEVEFNAIFRKQTNQKLEDSQTDKKKE